MEVEMSTGRYDGIPFVPEKGFYQPSSDNTREAYQALTSVIECYMNGRVPPHAVISASDEVLSVLKSDLNFGYEKKQEIEKLIGLISLDTFQQLVAIGNWITDYTDHRPAYNYKPGDLSGLFYRPSNEDNWRSYNLFLDAFQQLIGDQPGMVLRVAADSALLVLKNVNTPTEYRKHVLESEIGPASRNWFDHLSSLANMITDYPPLPSPGWETPNWEITAGTNHYPHEFSVVKEEAEAAVDIEDYFDNVKFDFEDDVMASDSSSEEEEDEKVLRSPYDLAASNDSDDKGTVQGWMKDLTDDDFQEVKVGMQNLRVEREGSSSSDEECERVTVGEAYLTSESCSDEEYQKVKVGVRNLNVGDNSDEEWLVV